MLREVIDIASLEDFASGLARSAALRIAIFDSHGTLIVASRGNNEFAELTGHVLNQLPGNMEMVAVPAHDPPGHVAFVESHGIWYIVAPIYVEDRPVGFVATGEFREDIPDDEAWLPAMSDGAVRWATLRKAWSSLTPLDRGGQSHAVIVARWGARQIAEWCHRETRLMAATSEVALVGDIAKLLTGEQDLQEVLDRIVAETARAMQCPFASIRLYDPETHRLTIKAVHNLSPGYVGKGAIVRTEGAVSDEALRGHVVYVEDVTTDPRVQFPEEARREGIVSMLTAGMIYRGVPVGVIRVYTDRKRRFRKAQRDLLRAVAYQAATAIVHAQLIEERLQNAETTRQLALAGDLQERIMRIPPPHHPYLETALAFHPTYEVAGDFGDFFRLADGRLAAVVGDVVGKGIPASLLMATIRGALRAYAHTYTRPGELLTHLNQQVVRETLPAEFATLLLVAIDDDARNLTYASAGHEPLLILRRGYVRTTDGAGLVLGVNPDEVYEDHPLPVETGDLLLAYTDGAIDARNFRDEEFGRSRLYAALEEHGHLGIEDVLGGVVWSIRRFVGLADQSDDLTLLGIRVK